MIADHVEMHDCMIMMEMLLVVDIVVLTKNYEIAQWCPTASFFRCLSPWSLHFSSSCRWCDSFVVVVEATYTCATGRNIRSCRGCRFLLFTRANRSTGIVLPQVPSVAKIAYTFLDVKFITHTLSLSLSLLTIMQQKRRLFIDLHYNRWQQSICHEQFWNFHQFAVVTKRL